MALKLTRNRVLAGAGAIVTAAATAVMMLSGPSITVAPGGDLQAAINAAQPGDTIVLQAGGQYSCPGGCVLPKKEGAEFIIIKSSRYEEIPVRDFYSRQPTTEAAQMMAQVSASFSTEPIFATAPGAHHYKLLGLNITPVAGQATRLVEFGTSGATQDTLEEVPSDLVIDKSWIHAGSTQDVQRCVALNSKSTDITNSWISECHGRGYDTQAIACWNGPGPYNIINNYLEGAGENVIFGGSPPSIPNLIPTGIKFLRNYVLKPLSWYERDPSYAGIKWSVKNLFELKNSRNVVVEGNVFDGTWTDAQAGRAIVFTPRPNDSGVWAVIEDTLFVNNIVRNTGSGILILGADEPPAPNETRLRRMVIRNNLWEINGGRFSSNGFFATVINKTEDVAIENNTVIQTGNVIGADYAPNVRFIYRNNISRHNQYGIFGGGIGNPALTQYFPGAVVTGNVMAKEVDAPGNVESIYPAGNHFPASLDAVGFVDRTAGNYRLSASSPYKGKGSDGKDPGCDIDALEAALGGSGSGPTPAPTTSTSPSPTVTIAGESPSNIRIPPATQITDNANNVWTRLTNGNILRNAQNTGGVGSIVLYCNRVVYAFGTDSQWYRWGGSWSAVGVSDPCGGASPSPTSAPSVTPIPSPSVQPLPSLTPLPSPTATSTPRPSPSLPACAPNSIIGNPARCLCTTGVRCTGGNARCL